MKRSPTPLASPTARMDANKARKPASKYSPHAEASPGPPPGVNVGLGNFSAQSPPHHYPTRKSAQLESTQSLDAAAPAKSPSHAPTHSQSPHSTRANATRMDKRDAVSLPTTQVEAKAKTRTSLENTRSEPLSPPVRRSARGGIKRRLPYEYSQEEVDELDASESTEMDISTSSSSAVSGGSQLTNDNSVSDGQAKNGNPEETQEGEAGIFGLPEAPVFYPTAQEFADPNAFIARIQPLVEPYGICRIVPPKEWKRDAWKLSIDPRTFAFNTKTQSVHSLQVRHGPYCRFLMRLQYYWAHVVGEPLTKAPIIDDLPVDLYRLHSLVQSAGGYEHVKKNDTWTELFKPLHLNPHATCASSLLAKIYKRHLLPFDLYVSSGGHIPDITTPEMRGAPDPRKKPKPKHSTPVDSTSSTKSPYFTRRNNKKPKLVQEWVNESASLEVEQPKHKLNSPPIPGITLRALEKAAIDTQTTKFGPYGDISKAATKRETGMWRAVRAHSFVPDQDLSFVVCFYCNKGDKPASLVLCDTPGCAGSAHLKCMTPPRSRLPSGQYYCPSCCGEERPKTNLEIEESILSPLKEATSKFQTVDGETLEDLELDESLGFGHGFGRRYTLTEFQEMAMKFATFWFSKETLPDSELHPEPAMPPHESSPTQPTRITRASSSMRSGVKLATSPMVVSADEIEHEYWRLVSKGDHLVSVKYGSDVDVSSPGASSGFPLDVQGQTVGRDCPELERWRSAASKRTTGTNLTKEDVEYLRLHGWNLNSLPYVTLLKYLNESVSGVTRPMMYIGMLFSSFCWHTEDNWLYSINYIHTGAPKRWYGVSGHDAASFEYALRCELPRLFATEPQLLYQLTTTLHPETLKKRGVRMCTTLQHEGEFVVTFPRAYHGGFNCGYNVAESVNFACPPWLDWGLSAVNEYRFVRSSVFAHEKILWSLATHAASITDLELLRSIRHQLELYTLYEKRLTRKIQKELSPHRIPLLQFTKTHWEAVMDESRRVALGVKEVPDDPASISKRTHVNLLDRDGFEPLDPQCYVCGYDLFFHRVDCACKTPRMPRCLRHALHPICRCHDIHKFISFRMRATSTLAIFRLLDTRIMTLEGLAVHSRKKTRKRTRKYVPKMQVDAPEVDEDLYATTDDEEPDLHDVETDEEEEDVRSPMVEATSAMRSPTRAQRSSRANYAEYH